MADRPPPPAVAGVVGHRRAGQVDGETRVGQQQAHVEVVDAERVAEDPLDVFGGGAAGAEVVEEARHLLQGVEAGAVEPTVDRVLEAAPEGAERGGDGQGGAGGGPRRAAPDGGADHHDRRRRRCRRGAR